MGGVRLMVEDEDADRAGELLAIAPLEDLKPTCPHCGSNLVKIRDLSLVAAIGIAIGSCIPKRARKADCLNCRRVFDFP